MKKKMIALLAGALLALSAGNALAYFGAGELNLYAYNNTLTSSEVGVDLGSLASLMTPGADTLITKASSNLTGLKTGATYVYAGIYGVAANGNVYAIANKGLGSFAENTSNYINFTNANSGVNNGYTSATSDIKTIASKGTGASNTYFGKMDKGNNFTGTYASVMPTSMANQGDFRTTLAADVQKGIYLLDVANGSTTFKEVGTATFFTNGNIEVQADAASTPIPPAFLLMGSGLLGMVGLRRKKA
ncbi:hypothetical protein [Geomesophilobacter sediminis]|uniref:PEP-CTERM protein-sorting domain-containing protein n=1 Tax=Geomesophilobacter sediminis TaxID=2798584 RepID=A0A8J7LU63_9BACT|nr:hypothetical protein [Geomesophilobacter sediminis]MBJ6724289.1 hypothetical protein [Geomesophilobacter sediminis]